MSNSSTSKAAVMQIARDVKIKKEIPSYKTDYINSHPSML